MRRHRVQNKYTINFGKKIQEAMRNAKASPKGRGFGLREKYDLLRKYE